MDLGMYVIIRLVLKIVIWRHIIKLVIITFFVVFDDFTKLEFLDGRYLVELELILLEFGIWRRQLLRALLDSTFWMFLRLFGLIQSLCKVETLIVSWVRLSLFGGLAPLYNRGDIFIFQPLSVLFNILIYFFLQSVHCHPPLLPLPSMVCKCICDSAWDCAITC